MEGEAESDAILKTMLVVDNLNPSYAMDFQKFLATVTGSVGGGALGSGVANTAGAYY